MISSCEKIWSGKITIFGNRLTKFTVEWFTIEWEFIEYWAKRFVWNQFFFVRKCSFSLRNKNCNFQNLLTFQSILITFRVSWPKSNYDSYISDIHWTDRKVATCFIEYLHQQCINVSCLWMNWFQFQWSKLQQLRYAQSFISMDILATEVPKIVYIWEQAPKS